MKHLLRLCVLLCCMVVFSAPALAAGGLRPASLCAEDEALIFTCPVAGDNLLSVCASQEFGPELGFLQYRYGPEGKSKMFLPTEKTVPAKAVQSGMLMFSGGGGAYLQFSEGTTMHTVYSAIGRWGEGGEGMERSGVVVKSDGKVVSDIRCQKEATSELGPEFFEKAGLSETEDDFELP